jgi:hypothetical protein
MPHAVSIRREVKEKTYWTFVSTKTLISVDVCVVPNVVRSLGFRIPMSTSDIESGASIWRHGWTNTKVLSTST